MLGLGKSTPNCIVYGEVGKYPIKLKKLKSSVSKRHVSSDVYGRWLIPVSLTWIRLTDHCWSAPWQDVSPPKGNPTWSHSSSVLIYCWVNRENCPNEEFYLHSSSLPGIEPGTICVWGRRDNRYTTEADIQEGLKLNWVMGVFRVGFFFVLDKVLV